MQVLPETEPSVPVERPARRRSVFARLVGFIRSLGPMAPLAAVAGGLPGVGAFVLYGRLGVIADELRQHPMAGPLSCVAAFGIAGGVALVPTYALSALCGWCFGAAIGLVTAMGGFLLAALVGYAIGRLADRGHTADAIDADPRWRAVRLAMVEGSLAREIFIVSLLRLAPIAPFALTNVVMAAAQIRPLPYAIGSLFGMSPRTVIVVVAASHLSSVDAPLAQSPWFYAAGAAITVLVIVILGWIGKRALARIAPVHPDSASSI